MIEYHKPIPVLSFPVNVPVGVAVEEPLVCITADSSFLSQPVYFEQGIPGAVKEPMLRKGAFERLQKAASFLPAGYRLLVFDAWRPYAVQKGLYDTYYEQLHKQNPQWSAEKLAEETRFYVSPPSTDIMNPSVHASGGAVDVTITDADGNMLDMGTAFDDFTSLANTAAFEQSDNETVRNNRRMLYNCMLAAGFTNLPSEWWHYDYGNGFWACFNNTEPIYKGILE